MTQIKSCNVCKEDKLVTEFPKNCGRKDGRLNTCKGCHVKRVQLYYTANPLKKRDQHLRSTYGITLVEYVEMLEAQDGRCKICKTDAPGGYGVFYVDHCHISSKVRGLLCHQCNLGLGHFKDNVSTLASAILYLTENHDDTTPSSESDANWHRPSTSRFS